MSELGDTPMNLSGFDIQLGGQVQLGAFDNFWLARPRSRCMLISTCLTCQATLYAMTAIDR